MSNFTHKVGIEKNSIGSNTLSYDFWFSVPTHESITIGLGFRYIRKRGGGQKNEWPFFLANGQI